jgi:hypothetical protein
MHITKIFTRVKNSNVLTTLSVVTHLRLGVTVLYFPFQVLRTKNLGCGIKHATDHNIHHAL